MKRIVAGVLMALLPLGAALADGVRLGVHRSHEPNLAVEAQTFCERRG